MYQHNGENPQNKYNFNGLVEIGNSLGWAEVRMGIGYATNNYSLSYSSYQFNRGVDYKDYSTKYVNVPISVFIGPLKDSRIGFRGIFGLVFSHPIYHSIGTQYLNGENNLDEYHQFKNLVGMSSRLGVQLYKMIYNTILLDLSVYTDIGILDYQIDVEYEVPLSSVPISVGSTIGIRYILNHSKLSR
jgi:hypothetical protein